MTRDLTIDDAAICERAKVFARKQGKRIVAELTDETMYPSDLNPVSVFMAGSPGAGKTEAEMVY